jgi:hypothetical protein
MVGLGQFDGRVREVATPIVVEHAFGAALDPGMQLRKRVAWVGRLDFRPPALGLDRRIAQTLNDEIVLRTEVTVKGHLVGARRFGDRIDADAANPMFMEKIPGGPHDPLARTKPLRDAVFRHQNSSNSKIYPALS